MTRRRGARHRDGLHDSTLRKAVEKQKLTEDEAKAALERIHVAPTSRRVLHGVDLIIEAIPENLELKNELFVQADLFCGEAAIMASNTFSISMSKLAAMSSGGIGSSGCCTPFTGNCRVWLCPTPSQRLST
jgi:3-hydroxybutyryl-CoA dehydrogenase